MTHDMPLPGDLLMFATSNWSVPDMRPNGFLYARHTLTPNNELADCYEPVIMLCDEEMTGRVHLLSARFGLCWWWRDWLLYRHVGASAWLIGVQPLRAAGDSW